MPVSQYHSNGVCHLLAISETAADLVMDQYCQVTTAHLNTSTEFNYDWKTLPVYSDSQGLGLGWACTTKLCKLQKWVAVRVPIRVWCVHITGYAEQFATKACWAVSYFLIHTTLLNGVFCFRPRGWDVAKIHFRSSPKFKCSDIPLPPPPQPPPPPPPPPRYLHR